MNKKEMQFLINFNLVFFKPNINSSSEMSEFVRSVPEIKKEKIKEDKSNAKLILKWVL